MDVEHSERAEASIDAFIERRDQERQATEGERAREQLWQESVRRYRAKQGEDLRTAWYEYEMRLYRIHSGLASEHLARAEKLENGHKSDEERNGHPD